MLVQELKDRLEEIPGDVEVFLDDRDELGDLEPIKNGNGTTIGLILWSCSKCQ